MFADSVLQQQDDDNIVEPAQDNLPPATSALSHGGDGFLNGLCHNACGAELPPSPTTSGNWPEKVATSPSETMLPSRSIRVCLSTASTCRNISSTIIPPSVWWISKMVSAVSLSCANGSEGSLSDSAGMA